VAQQELFVKLGTGNEIAELGTTQYQQPWNVLVTDANGGPVANATVNLSILPTFYYKGFYVKPLDEWVQTITAGPCLNEDTNRNGVLDPGEDTNGNGVLDPGNVATFASTGAVSSAVITGSNGFGLFDVIYAQQFANWVSVDLVGTAKVAGSESTTTEGYTLPILASALKGEASPPGQPSPFGRAPSCSFTTEIDIGPATLANAALGRGYSQLLTASGGVPPYVWSLESGALPNGISLSLGGLISGAPSVAGTFNFMVRASDSGLLGAFGEKPYTLTVEMLIRITPSSLSDAKASTPYSQTLTASGGTPPYTWTLDSGALPSGITLSSGGVISGLPAAAGASTFTVRATDPTGAAGLNQYTLNVTP
jgi:hypothetical protein